MLRPTRAGWCFFAITFCVAFAALNTGNNLLYLVLSLLLAFLVLSGVLSESALRGIEVRRRLPREAFAGREARVGIEIHNRQRRVPAFAIVAEDCRDHGDDRRLEKADLVGRTFALRVPGGGVEQRHYRFIPATRGAHELAGIRVSTRFPFGLFSKSRVLELPGELLAYPQLDRKLRPARQVPAGEQDASGAPRPREGCEVSGLREHHEGDSFRRVHWKSSLRRGELLVREAEDTEQRRYDVRLQTSGQTPGPGFEQRVSEAASQVVRHLEQGALVGLTTDTQRFAAGSGARHQSQLLRFLAVVAPTPAEHVP